MLLSRAQSVDTIIGTTYIYIVPNPCTNSALEIYGCNSSNEPIPRPEYDFSRIQSCLNGLIF